MVNNEITDWIEDKHSLLKKRFGRPEKDEILEGNIISVLFKLGWPIMVATFLRTLYNLVDTFWLGRLPVQEAKYSVAAVSQAWTIVFMMMSIEIGLGIAGLALVSQHTGAKQFDEASKDAGQLYFIAILFSIIIGIFGYFLSPLLLDILTGAGTEGEALAHYGTLYLQIIFIGLPFMFMFFAFMFILRGWGDTITPMYITAIAVILNLIVDPILIFGSGFTFTIPYISLSFTIPTFFGIQIPKLGVQGAAIATISTRGIGSIISAYLLFSGKLGITIEPRYLIPDIERIKKFLKVGLPATFGRLGSSFGFIVLWWIIYRLPNPGVAGAAYGVGNRILNITFLVMGGLSMGMSTMVGQTLGADLKERAEDVTKKGLIAMALLMSIIAIILFLLRNLIIEFFMPGNIEVIEVGATYLMIFSLSMPFFGIFRGITAILGGSGHTTQQMGLNLGRIWGLRLPLIFIFAIMLGMNSTGVWTGMSLSNVIGAALAIAIYSLGWWKVKVISGKPMKGTAISAQNPSNKEKKDNKS